MKEVGPEIPLAKSAWRKNGAAFGAVLLMSRMGPFSLTHTQRNKVEKILEEKLSEEDLHEMLVLMGAARPKKGEFF